MPRPHLLALSFLLLACRAGGAGSAPDDARRPAVDSARPPAAGDSVELRVDRSEYRGGDTVKVTIVNGSGATYSFNPCTRVVERESEGAWAAVPETGRVCPMIAWLVDPRASREASTTLPSDLQPGRYRLTISLGREGQTPPAARVTATSPAFTVGR